MADYPGSTEANGIGKYPFPDDRAADTHEIYDSSSQADRILKHEALKGLYPAGTSVIDLWVFARYKR